MRFFKGNELIVQFMAMNIGSGIAVGMMNLIVPLFALSLDATSTEIGMIRGMMGIGDFLIVLPAGFLVDHFGSRKMYKVACVFGALTIIIISLSGSPWLLLLLMVVYGVARSFRTTALNADFFQHMNAIGIEKGGWFKGSTSLGIAFIGPLLGGIAAVYLGYSEYFLFTSLFLLVPLLVLYIGNANGIGAGEPVHLSGSGGFTASLPYYRQLLKNRVFVSATATDCFNTAFYNTFITFITVLVVHDFGLSPWIAAVLIALRGMAQVLVVLFCGRLLYGNHNRLYLGSFVMTILGILLLGLSSNLLVLGIATTIIGAFSGLMTLVTFTNIGSIDGEKGKIAGMFTFGGSFGTILGPIAGGILADIYNIQIMFLAFIPIFGIIAIYYFLEGRRGTRAGSVVT
jgi:MFS family permease